MEWHTTLLAGIAILLVLFLSGAPIYLAFLFAILSGVYFIIGPAGFPMLSHCAPTAGWVPESKASKNAVTSS